ncbi:MFS transporter [Frankia sp. AgB32]|uniref:MFS transporter n=1 Tax=Frankia sp. AgB32 TaxID=631119 RepID=UPI00200FF1B0|nr:MFS transporter [Frankia sp. AgB32]MCK9896721.1 MFS transporter [Frankia sp. AgB32]
MTSRATESTTAGSTVTEAARGTAGGTARGSGAGTRSRGGGNLGVLALAAAAYSLAQTAVVPGLGELSGALHTSTQNVSWVFSAYLVAAALLTPVIGRLGDMVGKRRMLIVSLVGFGAGSVLAALSPNIWVLVVARVIQGVGGGIFPLCFGLIHDTFPAERRPGALGVISAIAGIGAGAGLLMGGLLLDHASWQWIFWAGAIMAGAATIGALRLPDTGVRTPGRIDLVGVVLLAVGLTAPLIALTETSSWGWGALRTIGLLVLGAVVLVVFGFYERRVDEPLVDMRVLGRLPVLTTNLATLMIGFGTFGAFVIVPQMAQTATSSGYGFGLGATEAGLLLLPGCVAMLVTATFAGRLSLWLGSRALLLIGMAVSAVGLGVLGAEHGSEGSVIALTIVLFGGIGLAMAAVPNIIVTSVPAEMTGQATGVNTVVRSVGSALGSQVVATLLASSVPAGRTLPTNSAFTDAYLLGGAGLLCGALAAVFIPRRGRAEPAAAIPVVGAPDSAAELLVNPEVIPAPTVVTPVSDLDPA